MICPICNITLVERDYSHTYKRTFECCSINIGFIKRAPHYSVELNDAGIIKETVELYPFLIINENGESILCKSKSLENKGSFICTLPTLIDFKNFDKEKLLKKLSIYTTFS